MKLFAWIGEDEFGSGVVGLKQARVPAGVVPLVAVDRHKIDTPFIRLQLQLQADKYGKAIRLASFELSEDRLVALEPMVPSITCPTCQRVSHNLKDIAEKYCGHCHRFHADMREARA